MNKKTFKKRAFISAIAMLVVSAIVLTSATFAWFAMSSEVKVDNMKLSITSPQGVQISANPFAFTTAITATDLKTTYDKENNRFGAYIGNRNYIAPVMEPVTTAFCQNGADNKYVPSGTGLLPGFYKGEIDSTGRYLTITDLSKREDEETTYYGEMGAGYTVFDVFVKVSYDRKLFFSDSTITCTTNSDVPSAMRMGFLNCGVVPSSTEIKEDGSNASVIRDIRPTGRDSAYVLAFDADYHTSDARTLYGIENNKTYITRAFCKVPTYTIDLKKDDETNYAIFTDTPSEVIYPRYEVDKFKNNSKMIAYDGRTNAIPERKPGEAEFINYVQLKAGINKIRVYIWMEGQDYDCARDVAGNDILAKVIFDIDIEETDPSKS